MAGPPPVSAWSASSCVRLRPEGLFFLSPALRTSFERGPVFKGPASECGHVRRCWGLGLRPTPELWTVTVRPIIPSVGLPKARQSLEKDARAQRGASSVSDPTPRHAHRSEGGLRSGRPAETHPALPGAVWPSGEACPRLAGQRPAAGHLGPAWTHPALTCHPRPGPTQHKPASHARGSAPGLRHTRRGLRQALGQYCGAGTDR